MAERPDCSSQNSLAKKSGISQSHVGRILRGESDPTLETIEALTKALKVTPSILLTEKLGRKVTEEISPIRTSPAAQDLIERITAAEASGASSPHLISTLAAILDLVNPAEKPDPTQTTKQGFAMESKQFHPPVPVHEKHD